MIYRSTELETREDVKTILIQQDQLKSDLQTIKDSLDKPTKHLVYGIKGLAKLCGCSVPTAQRIKSTGIIADAVTQINKTIIIDADLALQLLHEAGNAWTKPRRKKRV